jgi:aryl-alcohol dehydrogenase-like predicted oxidoreductase
MGCWAIGGPFWRGASPSGWGEVDDEESIRAIHAALELGITFFDTANVYGAGHSELVLGRALKGVRNRVVIASKFNAVFDEQTRQVSGSDTSPQGIRDACEASLKRLGTDHLELLQFHDGGFPVEQAGPVRDTLEALVHEGKIRSYGWSTDLADRASFFAQGPGCSAIQLQLNVFEDNPAVLELCERENLAAINRGPLVMGLLTGKYTSNTQPSADDVRGVNSPAWMKYFQNGKPSPEYLTKLDAVRQVLTSGGRTLSQGALAWLWARSPTTLPIPGFRTVAQVTENCGALKLGPLTSAQMAEIGGLLAT